MYAKVIIEYPVKNIDKDYIYRVPKEYINIIKKGMKVLVYFGPKIVNGIVIDFTNDMPLNYEIKSILKIVDENLFLSNELTELGFYMAKQTLATRISCFQCMLPAGFKIKTKKHNYDIFDTYLVLNKTSEEIENYIENNKKSKKKILILREILLNEEINKKMMSKQIFDELLGLELVKTLKKRVYRIDEENHFEKIHKLTNDQDKVVDDINLSKYETHLIYGVTGSGKTEVYLELIEKVLSLGKTAILLAPEISLTMQLVKRFYARFKNNVAVLHSALSDGERHDEYLKIMNKEVKVVVGTRSAVFAPLQDLGIIIIDEEHSHTYKQDNNPRYNAKEMAEFRCKYNNCPFVLGSATPLLETSTKALKKEYKLHLLKKRVNDKPLPLVKIVDMTTEVKKNNFLFSEELLQKINEKIELNEQIVLLLNRRGYSTFVNCSNCGFSYKCPDCDISLTYHKHSNNLICHYCGFIKKKDCNCPNCRKESLNYIGVGTEQVEEFLNTNVKDAKVIRMDQDTTSRKGSHDKIIKSFKNEEYNILLGTQMISKGLDFPNVTLVGVINADTTLNIPDYKSSENTFSLLSQVAGRSGRGNLLGEVIIQTYNPDNFVINCVKNHNYNNFYAEEMKFRKSLKYPPYYNIVGIKIISTEYELALSEAKKSVSFLKQHLDNNFIILGPTTSSLLKYKNKYRFQIIIKYINEFNLKEVLRELDSVLTLNNKVYIECDFNPNSI